MGEIEEKINKEYMRRSQQKINDATGGGLYPDSPFWFYQKLNVVEETAKEMGLNLRMQKDKTTEKFIRNRNRFPLLKNYKFLLFMTRIYYLKNIFKRTHTLDGLKFWVRSSGDKMYDILKNYQLLTTYEPETTRIVKENVRSGDACVDIGASIGYFTLQLARQVGPTGKVIAIEPTDFQQPYLKKNIEINGFKDRVKQFAVGAWDKDEIVSMPRNAPEHCQTHLKCRAIDDVLEEQGIMSVDFIKIDTDGAEPNVLKGLLRTIERSPNLKMVIEYYPKYVADAGLDIKIVDEILDKYFNKEVIPGDYGDTYWNYYCTKK